MSVGATRLLWGVWVVLGGAVSADEFRVHDADEFRDRIRNASPGDRVVMVNGPWTNVELIAEANGSADALITVEAETPGKVLIRGNSRLRIGGQHLVVRGLRFREAWHRSALVEFRRDSKTLATDCRLTDCELIDCNPPDPSLSFKYVSIYGQRNVVDHCRLQGKSNRGTTLVVWLDDGLGKHQIHSNHFGPRPFLGTNEGETVRVGDSSTAHLSGNCTIEGNLFEECNGETEIISNKSRENLYQNNVFLRCSGTLTLRHGGKCRVLGNSFLGQKARGSGGVRVIGSGHVVAGNYFERLEGDSYRSALCVMNGIPDSPANGYEPVEGLVVLHNTFYDCKRSILIGGDNDEKRQLPPSDLVFANNAIVSRRGPLIDMQEDVKSIAWYANLWFGDGTLGIEAREGVKRCDVQPLEKIGSRWTIHKSSPLVDAGYTLAGFEKAEAKRSRPDIGCDPWPSDHRSDSSSRTVGPSWSPTALP